MLPALVSAALATAAVLIGWTPSASAASCDGDGPCVVVDVVGTTTMSETFSLADLDRLHDINNATYALQSSPHAAQPQPVNAGTSLNVLVASMIDPDAVTYTEVFDAGGVSHPLSQGELGDAAHNGFEGGLMPVVYSVDQDTLAYIRPLRDPDDVNVSSDPNLAGYFLSPTDGPLNVKVHTSGVLLAPTIHADATKADVGGTVGFSVTFPSKPDTALTYAWDFGDGTTSSAAAPSHAWSGPGTDVVSLQVTGADGSSGRAADVTIDVASTPTPSPSSPAGTGSNHHKNAPVTGPQHSNGKDKGGKTTSHHDTSAPAPTPSPGAGGDGTTVVPPPSGAATTEPTAAPSVPTAPSTVPGPQTLPTGTSVSGVLILAADQLPSASTPHAGTKYADAARSAAEHRLSVPGWVWPTLVAVLLLGFGALGESRRARDVARGLLRRATGRMGA